MKTFTMHILGKLADAYVGEVLKAMRQPASKDDRDALRAFDQLANQLCVYKNDVRLKDWSDLKERVAMRIRQGHCKNGKLVMTNGSHALVLFDQLKWEVYVIWRSEINAEQLTLCSIHHEDGVGFVFKESLASKEAIARIEQVCIRH